MRLFNHWIVSKRYDKCNVIIWYNVIWCDVYVYTYVYVHIYVPESGFLFVCTVLRMKTIAINSLFYNIHYKFYKHTVLKYITNQCKCLSYSARVSKMSTFQITNMHQMKSVTLKSNVYWFQLFLSKSIKIQLFVKLIFVNPEIFFPKASNKCSYRTFCYAFLVS